MADRSVKVTIGANVSPLKAAMTDGSKSVDGLGGHVTTLGDKIKKGLTFVGITGGIVSLGAAIKGTFTLGLDFTTQLNTLQAVTQATGDQMAEVSKVAKQLGNDVEIPATSASDAAEAMTELAKGGLSVQQAMDAAKGTLQLAAAAQVSGAEAATIQANALNTFGLSASDAGHVADVLANTANAASGEITDFAQAMQQSGSVAKLFGIDIEDTSTALGLFANNGIKGSDAGTSLKSMLTQLATPSSKAKAAMEELGLEIYDSQGQFVGLRDLTGQLAAAQGRMSDAAFQSAAGIVFGSDAIRSASILASEGVDSFDRFKASVERAGGAADLATAKMKGLPGALQNMQNSLENVALEVYERVAPAVESLVNWFADAIPVAGDILLGTLNAVFSVMSVGADIVGGLADVLGALPTPIRDIGLALIAMGIASKIGLLDKFSGAWNGVRSSVKSFREEMELQKALSRTMPAEYDAFGNRLAIVGTQSRAAESGISNFGAATAVAKSKVGAFFKAIGPTAAFAAGIGVISSIVEGFTHVNQSVQAVQDSVSDLGEQLADNNGLWDESIQKAYESAITSSDVFKALIADGADYGKTLAVLTGQSDLYGDATSEVQSHLGALTRDQVLAFGAMLDMKGATEESAASLEEYRKRVTVASDATQAGAKAQQDAYVAWLEARGGVADASDVIVELSDSWDRARKSIAPAKTSMETMTDRIQSFTDAATAADTRLKFFTISIDELAGRNVSLEQATKLLNDQTRALTEGLADASEATKGHVDALIRADGSIDTATEAGSRLYDTVSSYRDAYDKATSAARDNALANGSTVPQALAAARAAADNARDGFIAQATAAGLSQDEAEKLADKLGILQGIKIDDKAFAVTAEDKATATINHIKGLIDALQDKTITLTTIERYQTAKAALNQGYGAPGYIPGGKDGGYVVPGGFHIPGAANGEWITGGIPGQDSVLRWLMPDEAVIPAANARANKPVVDALISGRPVVMPQSDNGALVAEVRALRAETARLTSVVASSSAQNAATVVGGFQDQADRDLLKSRKRSL